GPPIGRGKSAPSPNCRAATLRPFPKGCCACCLCRLPLPLGPPASEKVVGTRRSLAYNWSWRLSRRTGVATACVCKTCKRKAIHPEGVPRQTGRDPLAVGGPRSRGAMARPFPFFLSGKAAAARLSTYGYCQNGRLERDGAAPSARRRRRPGELG